jgi:hypothetical protein
MNVTNKSDKAAPAETIENTTGQGMQGLLRVAAFTSALCLGCAVASLQALSENADGIFFRFSTGTVVAFVAGVAGALLYWKLALANFRTHHWKVLFFGMGVAGLGMFLYPLRFVPRNKMHEIAIGLGTAACAISLGGFLLYRLMRFLNADGNEKPGKAQGPG